MFLDKVKIWCKAGNGGNGAVSFYRDKNTTNGGPDGGEGGKGGDIVFRVDSGKTNLDDFRYTKHFRAGNGENGGKNLCTGKSADDIVIPVPQGTVIRADGKIVADMYGKDDVFTLLHGGRGGRGNVYFKSSTRQTPRFCEMGKQTEEKEIELELKTIADVGLVGFPNVGKSSLLASVSNARPKIANYHFTTLAPNIGVVKAYDSSFVMADVPGLIEGASEGVGLGLDFLKHIERTRLLLHVVDISGSEGRDPFEDYTKINDELKNYSADVSHIPQIVVLNKIDLLDDKAKIEEFRVRAGLDKVYPLSAAAYMGLDDLLLAIINKLPSCPVRTRLQVEKTDLDYIDKKAYNVIKHDEHYYEVEGTLIDNIAFGVVLDDMQSFAYFQKRMKDEGVIDRLKEHGLQEGDIVKVTNIEFEYME